MRRAMLTLAFLALAVVAVRAEDVSVSGSDTTYPSEVKTTVGSKSVNLVLTGAALRKKVFFNVYTIGSYVQDGAGVRDGEELAAQDCPKQLHLVLERDVKGTDMADAMRSAIRGNYDDPQFAAELKMLVEFMSQPRHQEGRQRPSDARARQGPARGHRGQGPGPHRKPGLQQGGLGHLFRREQPGRRHQEGARVAAVISDAIMQHGFVGRTFSPSPSLGRTRRPAYGATAGSRTVT